MAVLHILCVAFCVVTIKAHCIPSPCQQEVHTTPAPVIGTTIIDNSVSNALVNALQLLIVSNLIEMTMKNSGSLEALQVTLGPLCDSISTPTIDIIIPDCVSDAPCEQVPSCDSVIDIIYYPDITQPSDYNYDFENTFIPNYGCTIGCDGNYGNMGYNMPFSSNSFFDCSCNIAPDFGYGNDINYNCGYNNFIPDLPLASNPIFDCSYNFPPNHCCGNNMNYNSGYNNLVSNLPQTLSPFINCGCNFAPSHIFGNNLDYNLGYNNPFIIDYGCNFAPNCVCGCNLGNLCNFPPSSLSPFYLPNIDCDCGYAYNQCGPIITEIIYPAPSLVPDIYDYGYGVPNCPIEIVVEPCYDNFYNPYHSNGYFYM